MLIYFSVENFRSIDNKIELNLQPASRLRRLKNHVVELDKKDKLKALRTAVIYGANAAGKSNLVKAMSYAKNLIVKGNKLKNRINIEPFKLSGSDENKKSEFYFEFSMVNKLFIYEFSIDSQHIHSEKLTVLFSKSIERCIFSRDYCSDTKQHIINSDFKDFDMIDDKSYEQYINLLTFTADNQLFLNEMISKSAFNKLDETISSFLSCACLFFEQTLQVIFPRSKYAGIIKDLTSESELIYVNALKSLDTGISDIKYNDVDVNIFPEELLNSIKESLEESDKDDVLSVTFRGNDYHVTKDANGDIKASSCLSIHIDRNGNPVSFELDEESDGTRRLLDLLPSICPPDRNNHELLDKTYVIDEFDRSLHPNLSKAFLKKFLACDSGRKRDQLIVTTHESSLLDNNLLRRDEIWFMQKELDGSSTLYSLNDYHPRFDKNIRNDYLEGKFGATPYIMDDYLKEC